LNIFKRKPHAMISFKKVVLPILVATAWIGLSEFLRNEFMLKTFWTAHYESMGLEFPSAVINNAVWGIWSLCFAIAVYVISRKFSLWQTTLLSWFMVFVLMWLVLGNMDVLPFGILIYAIPLSLLEAFLASFIVFRMGKS